MSNWKLGETFTQIFRSGWWGSSESVSGRGSELATTAAIREHLAEWLSRHPEVRTLFDTPCGDFNWMRLVSFPPGMRYIGGDIVADLIKRNNEVYGDTLRSFVHIDATTDAFPAADAWFCRDMMIHLPLQLCLLSIENCRRAGITYMLATTFINADNIDDIAPGHYRQVNLTRAPFDLGQPLEMLPDPAENSQTDRFIGVWRIT